MARELETRSLRASDTNETVGEEINSLQRMRVSQGWAIFLYELRVMLFNSAQSLVEVPASVENIPALAKLQGGIEMLRFLTGDSLLETASQSGVPSLLDDLIAARQNERDGKNAPPSEQEEDIYGRPPL